MKRLPALLPALFSLLISARAAEIPSRPNILFLLTDDQRWDTIHALGNAEITTPVFDRLVAQGFRFNNAFCQGSMIGAVCLPSRTMIVTGRSLWRIPENPRAKVAPPGVPLLPTLLSDAGYVTFHCGKASNACTFGNAAYQTTYPQPEVIAPDAMASSTPTIDSSVSRMAMRLTTSVAGSAYRKLRVVAPSGSVPPLPASE